MMPKGHLRLVLAAVMAVTLFLPWNPLYVPGVTQVTPTWVYVLWGTVEAIAAMFRGVKGIYLANACCLALSLLALPFLILLNIALALCPSRALRALYRAVVLLLVPLTWYRTLLTDRDWRGVGFWVNAATITGVALVEVTLLIGEQMRVWKTVQPDNSAPSGE